MYVLVERINGNKYFRSYTDSKVNIESGFELIETNSVPNDTNTRSQFYKLIESEIRTEQTNYIYDSNGNLTDKQIVYIPSKIYSWEFDEEMFKSNGSISDLSVKDQIRDIKDTIATLISNSL